MIGICLSGVLASLWGILELQSLVNARVKAGSVPFFCTYLPKVLLAISITVLDDVYKKIAVWLNDKGSFYCHILLVIVFNRGGLSSQCLLDVSKVIRPLTNAILVTSKGFCRCFWCIIDY